MLKVEMAMVAQVQAQVVVLQQEVQVQAQVPVQEQVVQVQVVKESEDVMNQ